MNKVFKSYDYLILIAMIYVAVDLSSMVFAYKFIEIGPLFGAASSLIFPLTYSIMDVVAEVYGYKIAKKIILYALACDFIFATFALCISHIPSTSQTETLAYMQVLGLLLRAVIAQTAGVLFGAMANIHLISKWKIMTKGRYFGLRSIGSSTIGEAIMLVISVLISLAGILSLSQIFHLIIFTYLYKVIFAIVAAPFVSIAAKVLIEKVKGWDSDYGKFSSVNILDRQDFSSSFQKS